MTPEEYYYAEERRAYPILEAYLLEWHAVVELAERCRKELGEDPITYVLRPEGKNFHRACKSKRVIEFNGNTSPLDVIHEVAHMLYDDHTENHAFVIAYLAAMVEECYLAQAA